MFTNLIWGGYLTGENVTFGRSDKQDDQLVSAANLQLSVLTLKSDPQKWISEVLKIRPAASTSSPTELETQTTWEEINDRSYIQLSSTDPSQNATAKMITDHVNWNRYLALIQGRVAYAPIKFNGMSFNGNNTGKGWDYRDWGADYWYRSDMCQNNNTPPYYVCVVGGKMKDSHIITPLRKVISIQCTAF